MVAEPFAANTNSQIAYELSSPLFGTIHTRNQFKWHPTSSLKLTDTIGKRFLEQSQFSLQRSDDKAQSTPLSRLLRELGRTEVQGFLDLLSQ